MAPPAFESSTTNTGTGGTSVTVASVPAGTDQTYLVYICQRDDSIDITSVSNTGGLSFVQKKRQCSARGVQTIFVYEAHGSPGAPFNVVVNFDATVIAACVAVLRYSAADTTTPVIDPTGENINGENDVGCSGGTDNSAAHLKLTSARDESLHIVGTDTRTVTITTPDPDYTQRVNITIGGGGDTQRLYVHEKELVTAGDDDCDHTLSSTADWCTGGLVLQPPPDVISSFSRLGDLTGGIAE